MKKTIKRVLAVFLSALLIAVSVPFSAFAATDAEATALKTAITSYENAMNGTVYSDMSSVYAIYLNAVKAYDQYKYGGNTSVDLATITTQLSNATYDMQQREFSGVKGTIQPNKVTVDDSTSYDTAAWYKNVLWIETNYSAARSTQEQDYHGIALYQPGATFLYDGDVAAPPTGTVLIHGYGRGGTNIFAASRTRTLLAGFLTNNNLEFGQVWQGIPSNLDINWALWAKENQLHAWSAQNPSGLPSFSTSNTYNLRSGRTNNNYRFANYYTFTGTINADTPVLEVTPQITCYVNSASSWKTDDAANMTLTGTAVHIVNYKRLIDTAKSSTYSNRLILGSNYSEGGAASYLAAYDALTSLNISSYFTSSNNYNGAATAITNAINTFTAAAAPTADGTGYKNLRDAIDNRRAVYNAGSTGYTSASWAEFSDAFEDAQAIFANISAYSDNSGAQTAADRLNNAVLVTEVAKVDTTALEIAIDEALSAIANSSAFTSASYSSSNIASITTTAQAAVWGSQANYKVDASKLDDTPANQAIVAQQLAAVNNAIYTLRINTAFSVSSASGYSLTSAIAEGSNYNPADYANGEELTAAITTGQSFNPAITAVARGAVTSKVQEYITDVQAIVGAIRNLQPAFSKIANGTIANAGQKESVRVQPASNREIYTVLDRSNNIIVFRRSAAADSVIIGEADVTHYTYANFDSHLDAIFLNDSYEEVGEIKSSNLITGNQDDQVLSSTQISGLQAAQGLGHTFDDGTRIYINNIRVSDTSTEYLGRDYSGGNISDTATDFTEMLTNVWGTSWPANGAMSAKAGATHAAGLLNLDLAQKTSQTLSASTVPVNDTYTYTNYFGSLFTWKLQDVWNYAGWSHGRTQYTETVNVIDVTTLMELIDTCDALTNTDYTTSSWAAFATALSAAKGEMAYGSMTAAAITTECVTRYTNLWNAYQGLVRCASNQPLKDALVYQSGSKANVTATYQAGQQDWSNSTWSAFVTAFTNVNGANGLGNTYSDVNVRNYPQSEQPTINALAQALKDAYDALVSNILVDDAVDAFASLKALLADYTYYASDLEAINTALAGLPNAFYAMNYGDITTADNAAALANEVSVINNLINNLTPVANFDKDAFQSYIAAARRMANDPDAYDVSTVIASIEALETSAFSTVNVTEAGSYIGLADDAQSKVDQAEAAVLSIPLIQYTVTVVDADGNAIANAGAGTYNYGTEVTVNAGTGNYTYDYVSNTSNTNASHKVRNIGTVDSFTFTVQGNTTITVGAPTNNKPVTVTYKAKLAPIADGEESNIFVIKTDYVASGTTITSADVNAPSYAFYSYQGFTQSTAANGDITVVLNYNYVGDAQQYEVYSDVTGESEYYYFNECITLEFEDSPVIAAVYSMDDIDRFNSEESDGGIWQSDWDHLVDDIEPFADLLAYSDTYTFRVKEDIYFLWLDQGPEFYAPIFKNVTVNDGDYAGLSSTVYTQDITNGKKLLTYSSYALPEGCTFVETGLLIHYNKSGDALLDRELTLSEAGSEKDMGNDKIRRTKATKIDEDEGCRFTITASLTNCSAPTAEYVVYLNYKKNGVMYTAYSEVKDVNF